MSRIPSQVKLPVRVAIHVVMQGIRTRFGRSLVTITGVLCGIAFLMSSLTSQTLKLGLQREDEIRVEVNRMFSFLTSEMGPPDDRIIGVIEIGPPSMVEARLLALLESKGASAIRWASPNGTQLPGVFSRLKPESVSLSEVGRGASAVLVLGQGTPGALPWSEILKDSRQKVVGLTRDEDFPAANGVTMVKLAREMGSEERALQHNEERKNQFRTIWIIVISLLVTVIGISNAMLMSVTERFREIGTMKCLGARSSFVRQMFIIESGFIGATGSLAGAILGLFFPLVVYGCTYGFDLTGSALMSQSGILLLSLLASLVAGVLLSVLAAIYPANLASRMTPSHALRSNV